MWSLRQGRPQCSASAGSTRRHAIKPFTVVRPGVRAVARGATLQPLAAAEREGTSYDALWDAFASKVQGEWEGVTVTFNAEGAPQPLPERYVPGAYREWGVELFDWQSQSSCIVPQEGTGRGLRNFFKRLMPTVGCEADAIAYVEEAEDVWREDGGSAVKPVTPAGGYVAAPAELPARGKAKVEACLAAPGGRSRLRAVVTLMQHWESKEWQLAFVDLSRETYDGPFNGGVELSGCAGGGKPFAKEPATSPQQLGPGSSWLAKEVYRYAISAGTTGLELQPGAGLAAPAASVATAADSAAVMMLPLGVWVSCAGAKSDVRVEVGALRGDSEREVAVCRYAEGRLAEVVLASEAK
ncbi:hypothetical protein PLESTB_001206300 [Pleodorina starrii]|uniref:Uncharacterized protein n=1 Tax=Pleodorina starrii TaxID=330485 RepID=A0A9W6F689_9CHLO|nr:hypothetical protein PLESTM_001749600 [Pleodorina starrii]GLC57271.1 hypothetical protein PLESTB_001206300 [Pleodorina starrii]GLC71338.1 hypothetical protein PLESTF_001104600 [Pleodorina starrii]